MWFTDGTDNRIGRIGLSTGTGIAFFSTGITGTARPQEIAAGPDGNLWFTENVTGRVARITPDGSIHEYGPAGSLPDGIAAGPDGNMWFHQEHAIGRITPDGTITSFPNESSTLGRIAAGSDGAMWFTDYTSSRIGRITVDGTITDRYQLDGQSNPRGIAAGPDGNMWFTETSKIGRITPSGDITEFALAFNSFARGIAAGPDGNMWFVAQGGGAWIGRITPGGTITRFDFDADGAFPDGIAAGPDGNMWVTHQAQPRISRIGTGMSEASVQPPVVVGSGQAGTQQACSVGAWAVWAANGPTGFSTQWLLDGDPIEGETGFAYTPTEGDVGRQLSCRVTARYPRPLLPVDAPATSAALTVIPQASGPQGPAGPQGPPGAAGLTAAQKPAVAVASSVLRRRAGRTGHLTVASINARTITVTARLRRGARNVRRGGRTVTLARARIPRGKATRLTQRRLRFRAPRVRGRYALTIAATSSDGRRATARATLIVRR
jgi:streptogramin lyase